MEEREGGIYVERNDGRQQPGPVWMTEEREREGWNKLERHHSAL